jgi:hypothetical protein
MSLYYASPRKANTKWTTAEESLFLAASYPVKIDKTIPRDFPGTKE